MSQFNSAVVSSEAIQDLVSSLICGMLFSFCIYALVEVLYDPKIHMLKIVRLFCPMAYSALKLIMNIYIVGYAFFRDFECKKWVFSFPEKIELSVFLVGALAVLGIIDSMIEIRNVWIKSMD